MVLEKTSESPLDSKKIKPDNLKGNQPWILIGRTDIEAETPVFWSSDANTWLIGKVPDAGKEGGQKKRVSEDEMAGWHHQCNGHELGQTIGDGEGQSGLGCCSPWGRKESDTTGQPNNNNSIIFTLFHSLHPVSLSHCLWSWPFGLLWSMDMSRSDSVLVLSRDFKRYHKFLLVSLCFCSPP